MARAKTVETEPSSLTESYADWMVRCTTPVAIEGGAPAERMCEMIQELRQPEGGKRVLAISLRPAEGGKSGRATIVAPFGLLLSDGIRLEINETTLFSAGFQTCLPNGCLAGGDLASDAIATLANGEQAKAVMTALNGAPLNVNVPLAGFEAAWNRLLEL